MRLNSTVFNVEPATGGGYSPVDYVMNNVDGIHTYRAAARRCAWAPST